MANINNWKAGATNNNQNNQSNNDNNFDLKVILTMGSDKQRITGAPLRYLNDSPQTEKILA